MQITKAAFDSIPVLGGNFICIALVTFTFSTLLGWYVYAEKCVQYLLSDRAILPYRLLYLCAVFGGCMVSLNTVWALGDIFNGLMAIPNLISLILLSTVIARLTKKYLHS